MVEGGTRDTLGGLGDEMFVTACLLLLLLLLVVMVMLVISLIPLHSGRLLLLLLLIIMVMLVVVVWGLRVGLVVVGGREGGSVVGAS